MKRTRTVGNVLAVLGVLFGGCHNTQEVRARDAAAPHAEEVDDEDEVVVPASEIPDPVREAALAAVPGLAIEEAELEGGGVYCVHGRAGGTFCEVEIDARGRVIEIERGPDDEEDDEEQKD